MARRFWYPDRRYVEGIATSLRALSQEGSDGTALVGLTHSADLLESALGAARQPYYRTTIGKAAALLRSLVKNHPFVDGNKRIGISTTIGFLASNGYVFIAPEDEIVRFTVALAASEPDMTWNEVARWLRKHTISAQKLLG